MRIIASSGSLALVGVVPSFQSYASGMFKLVCAVCVWWMVMIDSYLFWWWWFFGAVAYIGLGVVSAQLRSTWCVNGGLGS